MNSNVEMRCLLRLGLATTALLVFAAPVRARERQVLHGHIPGAVTRLKLPSIGRLPSVTQLRLAIGLPLRNPEELANLLQQIYDPASPQYHHYLTTEEFTERFGPTKEAYQTLIDYAGANGFTISGTYPNRVVLDVDASVADIEKAFHLHMQLYQHPTEGRTFYAPDAEPTLDNAPSILDISGLDNYAVPRPRYVINKSGAAPTAVIPQVGTGSGPSGNFIGNDFRAAYVPGTTLNGCGQVVGLLQFDGYTASDITYYENLAGLPNVTLTNILIDGATGGPSGNGGELEVSLDIEMVVSMAPGVSKVVLYIAPNPSPWPDLLGRIASDNIAKQISCSWGNNAAGSPDPTSEALFLQMAAQGQSFFNASGDSDAFSGGIPFPSESTNVTQVGGTNLKTTAPGGSYLSETVWNDGGGIGSSGGISANFSIPPWQQGISMTSNYGSTTMRNVPDVAMTASNVYVRADGADQPNVRGTSCAAPLWAGFTALINQQAAANGQPPVGFINPAIYAIGKSASYSNCFHDTTVGNNGTSTKYPAVSGYDLCTGWGTPNGTNLINALVGAPIFAPVFVPSGSTLLTEGCTPTNGFIDPGETVTVGFSLQNCGLADGSNVVATLLAINGVTEPSGPQSYGTLVACDGAVSKPFTFTANGLCGSNITATLDVQANSVDLGTVDYTFALGGLAAVLTQNFDAVTAPALPTGWSTSAGGAESSWVTSTAQRDTLLNAAFSPDPGSVGSNELVSPMISIASSSAKLSFRNYYNLEAPSSGTTGYDGGVLEIKIGSGAFQDILTAGGSFVSGGYTRTISSSYSNPLAGRQAWSGNSGGFITTTANLPAAAAGQTIQLRWRCGTDNSVSRTGWYIDTVSVSDLSCCTGTVNHPPVINAASINPVSPTTTNDLVATVASTNDPDGDPITLTYQWQQSTNDVAFANLTGQTASTLSAAVTVAGDYYRVIITPNDGHTNGAPFTTASVLVAADSDGNGINDDWEVQYFGHIGIDPNADADGDGFSNLQEYQAGTNPTNSTSAFHITSIVTSGNDVVVSFTSVTNRTYDLQDTDSFNPTNWNPVVTGIAGDGTISSGTDSGAAGISDRFYRVRTTLPGP